MKIEEKDASDVKHLLFMQQQYITSQHFFLQHIHIKTSKLGRTRFRVRSQNHPKSPCDITAFNNETRYRISNFRSNTFTGKVCFDKQAQLSESGFTGQSQYEK